MGVCNGTNSGVHPLQLILLNLENIYEEPIVDKYLSLGEPRFRRHGSLL